LTFDVELKPRSAVVPQIIGVACGDLRRQDPGERLADQRRRAVAGRLFGGRIPVADDAAFVDDPDAVERKGEQVFKHRHAPVRAGNGHPGQAHPECNFRLAELRVIHIHNNHSD